MADGSPLLIEELASGPSSSATLVSALLPRLLGLPTRVRFAALLVAAAEAGLPVEHVDCAVAAQLERSGLAVVAKDRWWPRHPLLQESILELTEPSEVHRAHAVLGDLMADREPAVAARHAARAEQPLRAVALAEAALASAEGPLERARATVGLANHLTRTLPLAAWRLRVDASSALRLCGAYGEIVAAFDGQPFCTADRERHGMAHCNLATAHWELGHYEESFDHAKQALAIVRGTGSEAELLARAGLAMHTTRIRLDGLAALADAREALRIAQHRGQHVTFARTRVAAALLVSGNPAWREEIDGAVTDAVARDDPVDEFLARETRYLHAFVAGDLATALGDLRMVTSFRRDDGPPPKPRHAAFQLLLELLALGDRASILSRAQQLLADEPIFRQRAMAVAAGALAAVDLGRADLADRPPRGRGPVPPRGAPPDRLGPSRAGMGYRTGAPARHRSCDRVRRPPRGPHARDLFDVARPRGGHRPPGPAPRWAPRLRGSRR